MSQKILLLETSGRVGRIAIADETRILGERRLDEAPRHARDLAPTVKQLLDSQGWQPRDVTATFVSLGPGSYTGLRVGITSAKFFARATGCAILGIETYRAIALQAQADSARTVEVIGDAQQGKIYYQRFQVLPQGIPESLSSLQVLVGATWLAQPREGAVVSGTGLGPYELHLPEGVAVAPALREPLPASLWQLGMARLQAGERDNLVALEPLYLRPSSAEEKWTALGK